MKFVLFSAINTRMFIKVAFNILNKADRTTVYVPLNMYEQVSHIYMLNLLFPQAVYIMP